MFILIGVMLVLSVLMKMNLEISQDWKEKKNLNLATLNLFSLNLAQIL